MKTNIFKIAAIMLMLAGWAVSCGERGESGHNVPYRPCPCEEGKSMLDLPFSQGEAYLFKDYIPEQMANQINNEIHSVPFPTICWIVYDSKEDETIIHFKKSNDIMCLGPICNFPDFAKKWIIPENGCKVDFEGTVYEPCNHYGTADVVRLDYILTTLKRK